MFALTAFVLLGALAAQASPMKRQSETHTVQMINNCGQGTATFEIAGGQLFTGEYNTITGPLDGGLAWITGAYGCGDENGLNCGDVEFSLVNGNSGNGYAQNAADYSLQQNGGQTHTYMYEMDFAFNGCSPTPYTPGPCTGPDTSDCPGAFTGTDATDGIVFQCEADNVGITITFC